VAIYGTNLAKVQGSLDGWQGSTLPASFNGASVTIGGKQARIYYVSNGQIIAVVPTDVATGSQPVVVNNGAGNSAVFNVTIAATAPAIFLTDYISQPAIIKNSDFSLVTASNPAASGDVLLVYAT